MDDKEERIDMIYKINEDCSWRIKISENKNKICFHFENLSFNRNKYSYIFESSFFLQNLQKTYPQLIGIKTNKDLIKKFHKLLEQDEKFKKEPNKIFIPHLFIQEDSDFLNVIWTVETWGEKEVIKFYLPPKKLNNNLLLSKVTEEISLMSNNLSTFIEKINILDKKLEKLEQKIFPIDFENSLISNLSEYSLFLKWGSYEQKNAKSLKLLYKATRDGDDSIKFHNIVGKEAPTFTIIESKDGRIFGGFTTQTLSLEQNKIKKSISSNSQQHKVDRNAFLFSLSDKIKYEQIGNEKTTGIDVSEKFICYFSASLNRGDLIVFGNFFKDIGFEYKEKKGYKPIKFELSKKEYFEINDIEVYKVNY